MSTAITVQEPRVPVVVDLMETAIDTRKAAAQVQYVQKIMAEVMIDGEHYGVIPGTGNGKKTLLKSGAEKLCFVFRLAPEFEIVRSVEDENFILFDIRCRLVHIPSGQVMGTGMGSCSSREEKYGWRKGARACPICQKSGSIIKGKPEFAPKDRQGVKLEGFEKGGFVCFKKKDGCGANFRDDDESILAQSVDRVPTENIWEQHNTLLKMAQKRALVAATLVTTACSDIFTQDLEDSVPEASDKGGAIPPSFPTTPVEPSKPVAHATFREKDGEGKPRWILEVMLVYNAILEMSPEEAALVPEKYLIDSKGPHIWEEVLTWTKPAAEKWWTKVLTKLQVRVEELEKQMPPSDIKEDPIPDGPAA
ncbi:MAG TPA: hypothetical protein VNH83_28300 [Bryobacteraceae bacterium]|nr:hypothetical protein [Bryobacteraceae bacterium]